MASRVWPICSSYSRAMPKVFFSPSTLDDVRCDDALPEREHLGFVHLDRHLQPVMVGRAECFDACEVLDGRGGSPGPERFIDTEEMTVSVHENDRLVEGNGFAFEQRPKVGETVLLRGELRRYRRELV